MTSEEQAIFDLLKTKAVGKAKALKSDVIFNILTDEGHLLFKGRTQEQIREIIRNLVSSQSALIGSGNNGYYIISNSAEAKENIKNLKGRADKIQDRAGNLKDLWNELNPEDTI